MLTEWAQKASRRIHHRRDYQRVSLIQRLDQMRNQSTCLQQALPAHRMPGQLWRVPQRELYWHQMKRSL